MKKATSSAKRLWILGTLLVFIFASFGIRLMSLQVVHGQEYKERVEQGVTSRQTVEPARGEILDRYGRPFVVNRVGYDVMINVPYLPLRERNQVIEKLITLMEREGQGWIDNLPISAEAPFSFTDGPESESQIRQLKKIAGNLTADTDAQTTMEQILKKYALDEMQDSALARKIAGVRYEMERVGSNRLNPYVFAKDIPMDLVMKIREYSFALPGIEIARSATREYVDGELAPNIIGITGYISADEYEKVDKERYKYNDRIGKNGLEKAMESVLKGTPGTREILSDSRGNVLSSVETDPASPGHTIVTTIDKDLQRAALQGLEDQIKNLQTRFDENNGGQANAGAAVAVDVKTGEILAIANYPTYDLASYYSDYSQIANDPMRPMFNRAAQGTYVPGSIFKPVVGIGGLSEGIVGPDDTVECTHVYTRFPDYPARCLGNHGHINVKDALMVSCNIFFYDVGYRLGIDQIGRYANELGLGVPTGIEIDESRGRVTSPKLFEELRADHNPPESWTPGNVIQASIGQLDHKFTPVQLASYTATLANFGQRMKLHLVKEIRSYNLDEAVEVIEPVVLNTLDAPEGTFETIREGMVKVSRDLRRGSARYFFGDYPITVAAKTGSPEARGSTDATFICYAPAEDPEIAIAVVIEKGASGEKCAPVAKAILDEYFGLKEKQPTPPSAQIGLLP